MAKQRFVYHYDPWESEAIVSIELWARQMYYDMFANYSQKKLRGDAINKFE